MFHQRGYRHWNARPYRMYRGGWGMGRRSFAPFMGIGMVMLMGLLLVFGVAFFFKTWWLWLGLGIAFWVMRSQNGWGSCEQNTDEKRKNGDKRKNDDTFRTMDNTEMQIIEPDENGVYRV